MATITNNLGLIKPAGTDKIRISQINENMDILDNKIGPVGNTSLQTQLSSKLDSTGGEITGDLSIRKDSPGINFYKSVSSAYVANIAAYVDNSQNNRIVFRQRTDGSASTETYYLPVPDPTPSYVGYNILTTKNAVTVAQGGTGATTAAAALTNLGALPLTGGDLTGDLVIKKTNSALILRRATTSTLDALTLTTDSNYRAQIISHRTASAEPETYRLPAPDSTRTTAATFDILTTKPGTPGAYGAGDSFTVTSSTRIVVSGYITTDAKEIDVSVPVDRSLSGVTSASVSAMTGACYGVGGLVGGTTSTYNWITNCNIVASFSSDRVVRLVITKKDGTAFSNATTRTPLAINASITMTFS